VVGGQGAEIGRSSAATSRMTRLGLIAAAVVVVGGIAAAVQAGVPTAAA
jgi:rhodanese-related sulfurtransferase